MPCKQKITYIRHNALALIQPQALQVTRDKADGRIKGAIKDHRTQIFATISAHHYIHNPKQLQWAKNHHTILFERIGKTPETHWEHGLRCTGKGGGKRIHHYQWHQVNMMFLSLDPTKHHLFRYLEAMDPYDVHQEASTLLADLLALHENNTAFHDIHTFIQNRRQRDQMAHGINNNTDDDDDDALDNEDDDRLANNNDADGLEEDDDGHIGFGDDADDDNVPHQPAAHPPPAHPPVVVHPPPAHPPVVVHPPVAHPPAPQPPVVVHPPVAHPPAPQPPPAPQLPVVINNVHPPAPHPPAPQPPVVINNVHPPRAVEPPVVINNIDNRYMSDRAIFAMMVAAFYSANQSLAANFMNAKQDADTDTRLSSTPMVTLPTIPNDTAPAAIQIELPDELPTLTVDPTIEVFFEYSFEDPKPEKPPKDDSSLFVFITLDVPVQVVVPPPIPVQVVVPPRLGLPTAMVAPSSCPLAPSSSILASSIHFEFILIGLLAFYWYRRSWIKYVASLELKRSKLRKQVTLLVPMVDNLLARVAQMEQMEATIARLRNNVSNLFRHDVMPLLRERKQHREDLAVALRGDLPEGHVEI